MRRRRLLPRLSLVCAVVAAGGVAAQSPQLPSANAVAQPPPVAEAPPVETPPDLQDLTPAPVAPEVAAPVIKDRKPEPPMPPPAPLKRVRMTSAVLQAVDKVTAQSIRFEAPVGKSVRYENLVFTVRACEQSAPDEPVVDSIAYVVVDSQPRQAGAPGRQVYRGWMFASSPGLHPFQHPVYDAWLITCRTSAPPVATGKR